MGGWNGHSGRRPRIWLGCAHGHGYGIGLAEGAGVLVGGIERGLAQRVAQPGMVTGAGS